MKKRMLTPCSGGGHSSASCCMHDLLLPSPRPADVSRDRQIVVCGGCARRWLVIRPTHAVATWRGVGVISAHRPHLSYVPHSSAESLERVVVVAGGH